jgi:hypothetical protein
MLGEDLSIDPGQRVTIQSHHLTPVNQLTDRNWLQMRVWLTGFRARVAYEPVTSFGLRAFVA